jgi:hypothetical protein
MKEVGRKITEVALIFDPGATRFSFQVGGNHIRP